MPPMVTHPRTDLTVLCLTSVKETAVLRPLQWWLRSQCTRIPNLFPPHLANLLRWRRNLRQTRSWRKSWATPRGRASPARWGASTEGCWCGASPDGTPSLRSLHRTCPSGNRLKIIMTQFKKDRLCQFFRPLIVYLTIERYRGTDVGLGSWSLEHLL